jgi:hypothetical protein
MFKGTVRSNLDPFGAASDNELWHALKLVHLRDAIAGARADRPWGACAAWVRQARRLGCHHSPAREAHPDAPS